MSRTGARCSGRQSAFAPASSSTRRALAASGAGRRSPAAARPAGGAGGAGPPRASRRCSRPRRPRRPAPSATARTRGDERSSPAWRAPPRPASRPSRSPSVASTSGEPAACRAPPGRRASTSIPSAAAASAPATISPGALSPPSASTATRVTSAYGTSEAERLDLAALVGAAGRADAVRPLRRAALRAGVDARRLELVRRPALVAPRLRCFPLRDSHERPPMISYASSLPRALRGSPDDGLLGRNPTRFALSTEGGPSHAGLTGRT